MRLEDVPRLAALGPGLRGLALCPNVAASQEARARLELEVTARCSPSLQVGAGGL